MGFGMYSHSHSSQIQILGSAGREGVRQLRHMPGLAVRFGPPHLEQTPAPCFRRHAAQVGRSATWEIIGLPQIQHVM